MCAKSFQLCPTLCNPMGIACQAPLSVGILQAKILEWVAMPSSKGIFPTQGSNPCLLLSPALAGRFFTASATWESYLMIYAETKGWISSRWMGRRIGKNQFSSVQSLSRVRLFGKNKYYQIWDKTSCTILKVLCVILIFTCI